MSQYDHSYEPAASFDASSPPGYGSQAGSGWSPAAPTPISEARQPGIATAAAVLGFVEACLALALVVYALAQTAAFGAGDETWIAALVLIGMITLAGLVLLGSLSLVRGRGRKLLIGATIAELVLIAGLGSWVIAEASSTYDPYGFATGIAGTVVAAVVVGLLLPAVRLVLALQPPVGRWLSELDRTRASIPPSWSPETGSWVPGPGVRSTPGAVIAVLAPVAVLAVVTVVVLATSSGPDINYATDLNTDFGIDAQPGSDWSYLYEGGDPVEPPGSSAPEYDSFYDEDAQDCYDGDLAACDSLYFQTPVGSLYEWLGSTCGGRQEEETAGGCA